MDDPDDDFLAAFDDEEEIVRPRRGALRIVGATLLIGLIVLLVLVPGGWLVDHGSKPTVHPTTTVAVAPTTTPTLAGHPDGRRLSAADWRTQVGAEVLIGAEQPDCSGTITLIAGRRYITSARHCLTDVLEKDVVSPEPGQAQEITGRIFDTFHVFDPVSHQRLATFDRIAVGTGDLDLLVATTRDETSEFRSRPARSVALAPAVGDEVASFASSEAEGFSPQRLVGVYLGPYSFHDEGGHSYTVDLTGYRDPASPTLIGSGHSGSSATGAGGSAFGPLLFSVNRDTSAALRTGYYRTMGAATGLDLATEGIVAVDENLHLTPADYLRFDAVLHG